MTCHGWSTHAVDRCFNVNFYKLIELTRVTGRSNEVTHKYLLERFRMYEERGEHGMFSAKLDLNRGRFLGMSIVPKHSDQSGRCRSTSETFEDAENGMRVTSSVNVTCSGVAA